MLSTRPGLCWAQADTENSRIRRIVISSGAAVSTLAGDSSGYADGAGATARFNYPEGVALDAAGTVALVVSQQMGLEEFAL